MDEEVTSSLLSSQKAAAGKVRRVGPPDYEKELLARKEELREDEFPNLLLFPQQDVLVESEQRQYRTDQCSVPQDALQGHTNLFTSQCLKFYQSDLHRVKFKFSKYAGSHVNLIDEEDQQGLPPLVFEQDQIDAERSQQEEHVGSEPKSTLSNAGYLLKGPFPSEGGHSVSMKTYRKRWFELKGGPTQGGYSLVQYKDKNSTVKGKINLETCTDIRKNNRYKALGFDILTGDDKVYYPLAAENESDMEQWITVLSKAIGLDTEETAGPVRPYSHETLRDHQKKSMMRPELLHHSSITEQVDASHREDDRNELFILYPEIMDYCSPPVELTPPPLPREETGVLVRVTCQELRLRLVTNRGRQQDLVEPFFVTLALYDAMKGRKISEDFNVDLNTAELRRMVASSQRPSPAAGSRGEGGLDVASMANNVREAVFSVMFPHAEVYLVVRVDKVFQGSIQSCAEPYIKQGDSTKIAEKLSSTMPRICERLGQYHMPFAWSVRPLFAGGDQLDTTSEFGPLYRQERERMSCEDILRLLADYKSLHKLKLQTIPGTFRATVSKTSEAGAASRLTLSPSLLSLKGRSDRAGGGGASPSSTPVAREVREFPPLKSFEPHSHYSAHLSFIHHLYVYPSSLKYDAQKSFTKARNIAVCVQVKESDNKDAKPLPVIFSDRVGEAFTDHMFTTILHHCTTPTFYTEVKIKLPVQVTSRHHLLFTFHHVGCESQKTATIKRSSTRSAPSVENIVGYSWLPLMDTAGSRIVSGGCSLPVSANLPPGYLTAGRARDSPQRPTTPDVKWVEGSKPLFNVRTSLDSTIHTLDSKLSTFFAVCTHVAKGKSVPLEDLRSVTENLDDIDTSSLQFLPVLLNQLFHMICSLSGPLQIIKADVLTAVMSLVERMTAVGRRDQLEQYVEYVFLTEVDSSTQLSTHDELARLMLHFLLERERDDALRVVKHLWFLLGIVAKSMSQYLSIIGKDSTSSRKNRFLEDFGWHIKSMVFALLPILTDSAVDSFSIIANSSLALFLRRAFNLMDRGLVFTMVAKYFEVFDQQEREDLIDMRLEFLWSLCCHEHYIALNLPFSTKAANQHFTLNASYCEKHYLSGVLLQEVEAAIKSGSLLIRKKAIMILRNLMAKHESDDRYSLPGQKARVASLYLPLITMVMDSVDKLQWREGENADRQTSSSDLETTSTLVGSGPDDTSTAGGGGGKKVSVTSSSSTSSGISQFLNPRKGERKVPSPNNRFRGTSSKSSFNPPVSPLATVESKTSLELVDMSPLQSSPQASLLAPREKQSEERVEENSYQLSREETKSLLLCLLFVLKYTDQGVLQHWWRKCLREENTETTTSQRYSWSDERTSQPQLLCFFELLKICIHVFKYAGKSAISEKSSGRATLLRELEHTYMYHRDSLQKGGGSRRSLAMSASSVAAPGSKRSMVGGPSGAALGLSPEEADLRAKAEGALANEVGLTIIELMEGFSKYFKERLSQGCGDNALMNKYFSVLMAFLQVRQSTVLQSHVFAALRTFTHKYAIVVFKGSSMQCGALCYQAMLCCNSRVASTRAEATALLYLLMKTNFEHFKQHGFVRTQLQTTVALSKIMAGSLPESHAQLRRSLSIIPTYADHDELVKTTSFPTEVKDLVLRLKTILSSVAQMKEHRNDPEKLTDLHYNLTKSYANSPQLRFTWLESMAKLHTNYGNYSEVAQCYLHMAGLVGEYLKGIGKFAGGCAVLRLVSPNIEMEEGSMKTDKETSKEQYYSEEDIVQLLENALTYLEKAERYELMNDVFKLLLPFYERERNYKMMMEMYGRLHEAFTKVVSIMKTGKRYLGTYFRVAFYGHYFGDDNEKQYIYKEPKVTSLTELTHRLQRLYTRKFGPDIVQIIMESGKVNLSSLDPTKAFIQVTHVIPYFTQAELAKRPTKFEQENRLSSFVFETPFTMVGQAHGTVASQCIRKTVLTTSHWFPYVKKRILIIDQRQFELSPIEVAIEAMEKKRCDLVMEVRREPPDLVKLQLLLQGSISTQVNQGVQEYANVFLKDSIADTRQQQQKHNEQHIEQLKKLFRMFMQVCQEALDIHGSLISPEQYLWQEELKGKFRHMQIQLSPLLSPHHKKVTSSTSSTSLSTSAHSAADVRRSPK